MPEERFTVGVEEEYLVVDAETLDSRSQAASILESMPEPLEGQVQPELLAAMVEVETGVCGSLAEVRRELGRLRREVVTVAEGGGHRLLASGTHPFATGVGHQVTPKDRYLKLASDYQHLVREQLICGCHVHVSVEERDVAVQVMDRARPWLSVLLALTGNSPFWQGVDTGYASYRTEVFDRWPTTGTPLPLGSAAAFDEVVGALLATGVIADAGALYWDLRPSARYSTLEFRVADVCTTVDEAVMVAGLARSLVRTCHAQVERDEPIDHVRPEVVRGARWRAARHGLDERLVDLERLRLPPAGDQVGRFLTLLRPDLEEHGEWEEVAGLVQRQLRDGTGAARQRAVARTGGVKAVARYLADATAAR